MGEHRPLDERLRELEERKRRLEAKITTLSARDAARRRKDDDRRKILLGTMLLADLRDPARAASISGYVAARLHDTLTNDRDRALFADLLDAAS